MKALIKYDKGAKGVALREVGKPVPKSDELLIRISAAGICGTDIHIMHDEYECDLPVIMGHEFTGIVEEIGSNVEGFDVGDQVVAVTAAITCENCTYCKQGLRMMCKQRKSIGSGTDGAMAEFMTIPAKLAYIVPKNMLGSDIMAITEPLACVVRAVIEQSKIKAGDVAIVSGPGTIGLLTLQVAKLAGAFVIVSGTSVDKDRLALAKKLGADVLCDDPGKLKDIVAQYTMDGVDVAYECAGAAPSFRACLEHVKKRGNLAQVGLYGKPIEVDIDKILFKEVELTVSFASEPTSWDIAMRIIAQGRLDLDPLVSNFYPLEDWETAFKEFEDKVGFKIFLKP